MNAQIQTVTDVVLALIVMLIFIPVIASILNVGFGFSVTIGIDFISNLVVNLILIFTAVMILGAIISLFKEAFS